jgi:hypothetical protein
MQPNPHRHGSLFSARERVGVGVPRDGAAARSPRSLSPAGAPPEEADSSRDATRMFPGSGKDAFVNRTLRRQG